MISYFRLLTIFCFSFLPVCSHWNFSIFSFPITINHEIFQNYFFKNNKIYNEKALRRKYNNQILIIKNILWKTILFQPICTENFSVLSILQVISDLQKKNRNRIFLNYIIWTQCYMEFHRTLHPLKSHFICDDIHHHILI